MTFKHWLIAIAAAGLMPAVASAAPATVETPIGETAAMAPGLDDSDEVVESAGDSDIATRPQFEYAEPVESVGLPDGRMGLQDQFTPIGQRAASFHDNWLLPLITVISIFVLVLLLYAMIRFRRSAHPEPSRTTHHTMIEIIWTVVPVIILVVIAIPSIGLIRAQYSPPPADLTVKVIGNQWYWEYEYPDHGVSIVSNMLREEGDPGLGEGDRFRTDADGPALLAVDERLVIPAGATVKFIVTANDVLHSFAVPAFWTKMDAVPGRLNETWVKVDRPGVYFGQCSELCGARHAYMPIAVEVVPPERFAQWIASKGGTMPGSEPASEAGDAAPADATPPEAQPSEGGTPAEAQPTEATT